MEILAIIAILLFIGAAATIWDHHRMKRIAAERGAPDICAYARSFDFRNVDTKIMRQVYNHVQDWAGKYEGIPFPVKAEDCFNEIYRMHPDDLDDMYFEIADKLGISVENPDKNPYWNKVTTVRNLVLFLHNQAKINHA